MKDLVLSVILLMVFASGYYIMKKLDHFIDENHKMHDVDPDGGNYRIRISAESPLMLASVISVLESYPHISSQTEFLLSSGDENHILDKLLNGNIDIVLLNNSSEENLDRQFASMVIPYEQEKIPLSVLGLPIENLDTKSEIHVVWKKSAKSPIRDHVIYALENEYCSLQCGYADYLV